MNSGFENRDDSIAPIRTRSFPIRLSSAFSSREMPPSPPVPSSSELAAEEQKEKAVEQTTSAIEGDQAEPIAVDEAEEEEAGIDADDADEGEAATTTAAPGGEETAAAGLDFDLPRSILRRIVKARLSEVAAKELGEGKEFGVSKEALEALGEGAKVRTRSSSSSFENLLSSFFPTRPPPPLNL